MNQMTTTAKDNGIRGAGVSSSGRATSSSPTGRIGVSQQQQRKKVNSLSNDSTGSDDDSSSGLQDLEQGQQQQVSMDEKQKGGNRQRLLFRAMCFAIFVLVVVVIVLGVLLGQSNSANNNVVSNSSNQESPEEDSDGTSTTLAPPTEDGVGPTGTSKAPSDYFDLSIWKLQLPVGRGAYFDAGEVPDSEADKSVEILPFDCTSYDYSGFSLEDGFYDMDYFYADGYGAMILHTPLYGGATTTSSSYVRSELRELYNWDGASGQCDGDDDATWSAAGKHILRGTLAVVDYYDQDPQTVVAQIHAKDTSKPLLKLQWDGPTKDIRAVVNTDPSSGDPSSLDMRLIPGTNEFSYVLTLEDDTVTVEATYDSVTVSESLTFGSGIMSSDWNDREFYFKAGNYAQADKSSGGNFTVRYTQLQVEHS